MNQNELMHYGVLGMKWGVRRYQNEDGSYKKGAQGRYDGKLITIRQASNDAKKAANEAYKQSIKNSKEHNKNVRQNKKENIKKAIKEYNKAYSKAVNSQEKAYADNAEMKRAYEATGKNWVERVVNNAKYDLNRDSIKNESLKKAVKEYNKAYSKAVNSQEKADADNAEMKKVYKTTGKNWVERVVNNAKYDLNK